MVVCDTSAGVAVAGWLLNGVVEARRNVLVPFERGLSHVSALAKDRTVLCMRAMMPTTSRLCNAMGNPNRRNTRRRDQIGNAGQNLAGKRRMGSGKKAHHSPLPDPRAESLRPEPLGSRFWPAAADAKLEVS